VPESTLVPVQVLGELYATLMRRGGRSPAQARDTVLRWGDTFPIIETSSSVQLMAMELSINHRLPAWDAVILSAAGDASCRVLLSEDFQDGFTWSGVTVVNPFAETRHPLLDAVLSEH
jgi:predicted nucleic acid-binding protein